MRSTKRILSIAALSFSTLGLAAPAIAQLKARDITGVQLGMTAAEAEAALKTRIPGFKIEKAYYRGSDNKLSNNVGSLTARSGTFGQLVNPDGERLDLRFAESTGKLYSIQRTVQSKVGFDAKDLMKNVDEKYGALTKSDDAFLAFDKNGKLDPRCVRKYSSSAFSEECGDSLFVSVSYEQGLAKSYSVNLSDGATAVQEIKWQQSRSAASEQARRNAAEAIAKRNKQAL